MILSFSICKEAFKITDGDKLLLGCWIICLLLQRVISKLELTFQHYNYMSCSKCIGWHCSHFHILMLVSPYSISQHVALRIAPNYWIKKVSSIYTSIVFHFSFNFISHAPYQIIWQLSLLLWNHVQFNPCDKGYIRSWK